jgi:DNA-binding LytR/AlgR family response regulator
MNCIIIDDEPLARNEMAALVKDVSDLDVVGSFANAPNAVQFLKSNKVDLVFLDIQMPGVSGIEFAAQLPKETLVVFTTAYPQYALKSYELDAIDYLLKPIDKSRLDKAISKAKVYGKFLSADTEKNVIEGNTESFLIIKADRKFHKIVFKDIRYIEGLKDYVVIHTGSQKLITAMNLKTIHQKVPQSLFIRVSKSYLVNKDYVESFDHQFVYLPGCEIPLGEVYKRDFFSIFSGGSLNPDA